MEPRRLFTYVLAVVVAAAASADAAYNLPEDSPLICTPAGVEDGQQLVQVWVPLIGCGAQDDGWRPDIPADLPWRAFMVSAVGEEIAECPVHPVSGNRRGVLTQYVCGIIRYQHLPQVLDRAVPLADVPIEDMLLVELARLIDRDPGGRLKPEAAYAMAQLFWRERDRAREQEGYDMLVVLLQRMRRRGLPQANCDQIAAGLGEFLAAGPIEE